MRVLAVGNGRVCADEKVALKTRAGFKDGGVWFFRC